MIRFIDHIVEPDRLLLSWQPPAGSVDRMRRFVAVLYRRHDDADLFYLRDNEDFQEACKLGFTEYPGFSIDQDHRNVLAAFMGRLPPRKRTDFARYLESFRIRPDAQISDFALLGYSGAKLPDDDFVVVHPFDSAEPSFELMLPIQGYRYYREGLPLEQLKIGLPARFEKEPENAQDPQAIRILINDKKGGYVSRGLTRQFQIWMDSGYTLDATIERINGGPERPLIYLFVAISNAA